MLSLGGEKFIEAAETGDIVRITTFSQKFGLGLRALEQSASAPHDRRLYFGRIE
jgi:Na+/H+-dicarboxylate symporter